MGTKGQSVCWHQAPVCALHAGYGNLMEGRAETMGKLKPANAQTA